VTFAKKIEGNLMKKLEILMSYSRVSRVPFYIKKSDPTNPDPYLRDPTNPS
jgi:hypothetical protein